MGISGIGAAGAAYASPSMGAPSRNSGAASAIDDFMKMSQMTPAERMRAAILKSMGMSEDDLASMDPKKRAAVEQTVAQKIKQAAQDAAQNGKTGMVADVTV